LGLGGAGFDRRQLDFGQFGLYAQSLRISERGRPDLTGPANHTYSLFQEYLDASISAFLDTIDRRGGQLILAVVFDRDIQLGFTKTSDHINNG